MEAVLFTPRVRVDDQQTVTTKLTNQWAASGMKEPLVDNLVEPMGYEGLTKTMRDSPHPGFRRAKAAGQIVLGDMSLEIRERTTSPSVFNVGPYAYWGQYRVEQSGDLTALVETAIPRTSLISPEDSMRMADVALVRAYTKMNESSIMGGEILADLDKSVAMLKAPFRESSRLINKMYRRADSLRSTMTAARAGAKAWLEYRYGWKPIILDMETAIKEASTFREKLDRQRLVARSSEKYSRKTTNVFYRRPLLSPYSGWKATGSVQSEDSVRAHAGVIYGVENRTSSEKLLKILGYRPRDLPATLWEVTPYSFVVDWFANVGDWLQAITPVPGIEVQGSWVTLICEANTYYSGGALEVQVAVPDLRWAAGTWGASTILSKDVVRYCNPRLSNTPSLTVREPSVLHAVDGLSLSLGQLSRQLGRLRH